MDAELVLKAMMATHPDKNYSPNKKSMDGFYDLGCGTGIVNEYRQDVRDRFIAIMTIVRDLCINQTIHVGKGKLPQRQWWACVFLAQHIYENNLRVIDYADAYKEIYELEKDLIAQSKTEQGKDHEIYKKSLLTSNPQKEPADSDYYWHWASEPLKWSERKKRLGELFSYPINNICKKGQTISAAK